MRSSSPIRRGAAFMALLALTSVMLVACGGGGEGSPDESNAGGKNATPPNDPSLVQIDEKRAKIPPVEAVAPTSGQLEDAVFVAVQDPGIQENVNLYLFGKDGKVICPITSDGMIKYDLTVSPDGKWLTFMLRPAIKPARKDVILMNLATGESQNLTADFPPQLDVLRQRETGGGANVFMNSSPSVTFDGKNVIFASKPLNGPCHLYAASVESGELRQITKDTDDVKNRFLDPNASPATNEVVFSRVAADGPSRGKHRQLWILDIASGDERRLTDNVEGEYRQPKWSPDGSAIAFVAADEDMPRHWNIWVINADGSGLRRVTDDAFPGDSMNICWRPNGKQIAFIYREGIDDIQENNEVYVVDVETHEVKQLSRTPMFESSPGFLQ